MPYKKLEDMDYDLELERYYHPENFSDVEGEEKQTNENENAYSKKGIRKG